MKVLIEEQGLSLYVRFDDDTAVDFTESSLLQAGVYTVLDSAIATAVLPAGTYAARVFAGTAAGQAATDALIAIVPEFIWSGTVELTPEESYGAIQPTVAGRTLDVTATGAAGIDLANVEAPTSTLNLSGTTVGTITTYTGDTPQTGDSFARLGAPTFDISIANDIATSEVTLQTLLVDVDTVDGIVDAILVDTAVLGAPVDVSLSSDISNISSQNLTISSNVTDTLTNTNAILSDANELQVAWADGGRLDLILDARASQASLDALDLVADAILVDTGTTLPASLTAIETDTQDLQSQIGSDGAGLTALPWNAAWDAEVESEVNDALVANHLDHLLAVAYDPATKPGASDALLNEIIEDDTGVSRLTANALENAPSGTGASAATIADAVWAEPLADHSGTVGSTAEQLAAAGAGGDPWSTALPGVYGAGTAGQIIGDNLDTTASSRASQVSLDAVPTITEFNARTLASASYGTATNQTSILADTNAILVDTGTSLPASIADVPTVAEFNARSLPTAEIATVAGQAATDSKVDAVDAVADAILADTVVLGAPVGASLSADIQTRLPTSSYTAPLDATGTRGAIGMAAANFDTQVGDLPNNAELDTAVAPLATSAALDAVADAVGDLVAGGSSGGPVEQEPVPPQRTATLVAVPGEGLVDEEEIILSLNDSKLVAVDFRRDLPINVRVKTLNESAIAGTPGGITITNVGVDHSLAKLRVQTNVADAYTVSVEVTYSSGEVSNGSFMIRVVE